MKHYYKILRLIYDDVEPSTERIKKYCDRVNRSSDIITLSFYMNKFVVKRIVDGYSSSKRYEFFVDVVSMLRNEKINLII